MTSWRDGSSLQAQDDLDGLLNAALPFAQQQVETHGEFFPYGVALDVDGAQHMVAGDPDGSEQPDSLDVLAVLWDGLRSQRHQLRAVAVVSDVRLVDSDAIRVELEHIEGAAMAVLLPYRPPHTGSDVAFGELSAAAAEPQVWSV